MIEMTRKHKETDNQGEKSQGTSAQEIPEADSGSCQVEEYVEPHLGGDGNEDLEYTPESSDLLSETSWIEALRMNVATTKTYKKKESTLYLVPTSPKTAGYYKGHKATCEDDGGLDVFIPSDIKLKAGETTTIPLGIHARLENPRGQNVSYLFS